MGSKNFFSCENVLLILVFLIFGFKIKFLVININVLVFIWSIDYYILLYTF